VAELVRQSVPDTQPPGTRGLPLQVPGGRPLDVKGATSIAALKRREMTSGDLRVPSRCRYFE